MKKVLVIRWGGYGDMIMISPVLRELKKEGYHVTVNTKDTGFPMLKYNPNVDKITVADEKKYTNNDEMQKYWEEISQGYDRVINFSGSIENELLKAGEEFYWPKAKRHDKCNKNYYNHTMEWAGYDLKGETGEMFFTTKEVKKAKKWMSRFKNRFVVIWSLSGSSGHKSYPFAEIVAKDFIDKHHDAVIITVGGTVSRLQEWEYYNTVNKSDSWDIRTAILMARNADLVIGSETGLLNALGSYDVPKIIMLSHSTEENLTKYWKNTINLTSDAPCYPCHQLHLEMQSCPWGEWGTLCTEGIKTSIVLKTMEEVHKESLRRAA